MLNQTDLVRVMASLTQIERLIDFTNKEQLLSTQEDYTHIEIFSQLNTLVGRIKY